MQRGEVQVRMNAVMNAMTQLKAVIANTNRRAAEMEKKAAQMRKKMRAGHSFAQAHRAAQRAVGK